MKKITTLLLLASLSVNAQKIKQYTASNGKTYSPGDTINIGKGTGPGGNFTTFELTGSGKFIAGDQMISRKYTDLAVKISKIKTIELYGAKKILFLVNGMNNETFYIRIEEAIAACEIKHCIKK